MRNIILASASPRRKQLLKEMDIEFKVEVSEVEEIMDPKMHPSKIAMENAFRKASDIAGKFKKQDLVVIGSDTVVVYKKKIMGKPINAEKAFAMLKKLSGTTHQVFSGISVYDCYDDNYIIDYAVTDVTMWKFSDHIIKDYISSGEPFDKAGSYGIQGKGRLLVKSINGCYFNVVGLPIALLAENLLKFNINFFEKLTKTQK